jgi:5-methyltetrahydrofolate--homocysteine methyltransferase
LNKPSGIGDFVTIGENIHATRVLLRKGKRVETSADGSESILFLSASGEHRQLPVCGPITKSQDYEQGRLKHVKYAIQAAMSADEGAAESGRSYLQFLVGQQVAAGAQFLDINVDEISLKPAEQIAAMQWVVQAIQHWTNLPLSIDSSSIDVIEAGLSAYDRRNGRPMLNSASLERLAALDIAVEQGAEVIVTAAGDHGMPTGVEDRIYNASRIIEAADKKGIVSSDIYVDPLVFPISVDKEFAIHSLQAIHQLRQTFGSDIHFTGGFSNVSFGIPFRRVINDVFLMLAIEAGADSAIIDPVVNPPDRIANLDLNSEAYRLAEDVLMGRDEHCKKYIAAWRKGKFNEIRSKMSE